MHSGRLHTHSHLVCVIMKFHSWRRGPEDSSLLLHACSSLFPPPALRSVHLCLQCQGLGDRICTKQKQCKSLEQHEEKELPCCGQVSRAIYMLSCTAVDKKFLLQSSERGKWTSHSSLAYSNSVSLIVFSTRSTQGLSGQGSVLTPI